MTEDAYSPSVHCLSVCLSLVPAGLKETLRGRNRQCFSLSETENPLSRSAVSDLLGVFSSLTKTLFTPFNCLKCVQML